MDPVADAFGRQGPSSRGGSSRGEYDLVTMTPRGKNVRQKVEKLVGKLPSKMHVDHIVPKADGGGDALKNLQVLPEKVHQKKTAIENAIRTKVGRQGRPGRTR